MLVRAFASGEGRAFAMLFLVRSAFWLGMVYSAMPFDNSEQARELARLRAALAATAGGAAASACAGASLSCALKLAGPAAKLAGATAIKPPMKEKMAGVSVNSLMSADLRPAWRGKPAKLPKGPTLAQRATLPI